MSASLRSRPNELPPDRRASLSGGTASSALSFGLDVGEYMELPDDPDEMTVVDTEDGGGYVDLPGEREESAPPDQGFYENLADRLPDHIKDKICSELLRRIEEDGEARQERDDQYSEGIRRTGLGKDAPGGAAFQGASKVVHPMLTEACIDYASRIMKELFPPSGPVKAKVLGTVTKEKTEKAKRKTEHMNWQITTQIKEARSVLETTFTQTPLGGSQFIRQWWDHRLKRPRWAFVPVDKIRLPSNAADFASAHRKTFEDLISEVEYKQRIAAGQYADLKLPSPSSEGEPTKSEQASQKVEGKSSSPTNLDGNRQIFETQTYLDVTQEAADALGDEFEEQGDLNPYIITIDFTSKKMLSMYRNWEDGDEAKEPIEHLFEFPFLPWRGALSIGFPHIIGGLSAAATGALRALLDSAHINNAAGGFIMKGAGMSGQTRAANPGEFIEIDCGLETDDIRKRILPNAMNAPSPVLFQLLGYVTDAAKGVVRTSLDDTPTNSPTPVPVGTQMSRVEEGLVVFSAVHGRAHAALDRLLGGLHRLNRLYLPPSLRVDATGTEIMVRRVDYEGPCDIEPVSDPTIYSDQQRFAQIGYIQQRMMVEPSLWDVREVELAGLKLMKYPDAESLLLTAPQPEEANAVTENANMALGKAAIVLPEQNHLAHLQVHLDFMKSPSLGGSPLIAPAFLPAALKHCAEHIIMFYAQHTTHMVEQAAQATIDDLMANDTETKGMFDALLATASPIIIGQVDKAMQGAMPVLMQAEQSLKALQPPPPMDPALAAVQAAQAETQRKGQADQMGHAVDTGKLQLQAQANAIAASKVQAQKDDTDATNATKVQTTSMDNATAEQIASSKIASGQKTGFSDGASLSGAP